MIISSVDKVPLEKCPALVLNADFRPLSYYPLSIWCWQDAVKSVFLDRVSIVSNYKRKINPTKFLPLWDLLGVSLGFGSTLLGKKAAMLCTASVEEVIDGHYKDQTYKLGEDEKELKKKIEKFRQDELDHKEIAYDNGATKKGLFGVLDKIIKTSSRIAITISEKI